MLMWLLELSFLFTDEFLQLEVQLLWKILQPGNRQVAAGYIVYGSSTMLVYTTGHGVNGFTYDPSLGVILPFS